MASIVYDFEIVIAIIIDFDEFVYLLANCEMTSRVRDPKFLNIKIVDGFKHFVKSAYLYLNRELRILRLPANEKHINLGIPRILIVGIYSPCRIFQGFPEVLQSSMTEFTVPLFCSRRHT